MRAPLQPADGDHYQRPHHAWACGLVEEGRACPVGPDDRGRCPAASACHPLRDGDRWHCNRSPLRGGPCPTGPGPEGTCAHVFRCSPVRSLRSRRGQLVGGCALAALGALIMTLSAPGRNEVIAPGPLSVHHAQLLDASRRTDRCGTCHAAGNQSLANWLGFGNASRPAAQSELCLGCHDRQIPVKFALAAHTTGRPLAANSAAAKGPTQQRRRDPESPIACSACHREHQGTLHDLSAIDNQTCQACHGRRIARFADDHPDFGDWPYAGQSQVQFDHGSHEGKHFPQSRQAFDCALCHAPDASGQNQATLGYDATCAACHDAPIERSWSGGAPLLKLPELDVELLAEQTKFTGPWPTEATGDFDGGLPEINRLLLLADPVAAEALAAFGTNFNAFDVDPDDAAQLEALASVATAQRTLIENLKNNPQETIGSRLSTVLERNLSSSELTDLVGGIAPDALAAYSAQWFEKGPGADPGGNVASRGSLGAAAPAALPTTLPPGGWGRGEGVGDFVYRPRGHADPWRRAWIDVVAEATGGKHAALASSLLNELLQPTAPGLCGSCHRAERSATGSFRVEWRLDAPHEKPPSLTFFDHGPHLTQPQLRDCRSCHERPTAPVGDQIASDFAPLQKQACATCHTPLGAGDSCTQCHRYHERSELLRPSLTPILGR